MIQLLATLAYKEYNIIANSTNLPAVCMSDLAESASPAKLRAAQAVTHQVHPGTFAHQHLLRAFVLQVRLLEIAHLQTLSPCLPALPTREILYI